MLPGPPCIIMQNVQAFLTTQLESGRSTTWHLNSQPKPGVLATQVTSGNTGDATSTSYIVYYQFTISYNTRSYIDTTSPDSSMHSAHQGMFYTPTHIDTHIPAYVHGYTMAPCTRSTKAAQLTVGLARRHTSLPVILVMKTI